jgi:hypothetical protein
MQKWFDMPVENLLVILIAVVVIGFVVAWWLGNRGGGIRNKTVIKGDNNKIINQQIDNSVRQTQINVDARVRVAPAAPPSSPGSSDNTGAMFFYGLAMVVAAFFYIRVFDQVAFLSMVLCALAVGAGSALLALSATNLLGDGVAVSLRAALLVCLSVTAAWFLYDAQQMIDPRLVQAAQSVPLDAGGIKVLANVLWRNGLWVTALASALTCVLCLLFAVRALVVARRIGVAGRLALLLDDASYRAHALMPSWRSMSSFVVVLALMGFMRFYWLPHALQATQR